MYKAELTYMRAHESGGASQPTASHELTGSTPHELAQVIAARIELFTNAPGQELLTSIIADAGTEYAAARQDFDDGRDNPTAVHRILNDTAQGHWKMTVTKAD